MRFPVVMTVANRALSGPLSIWNDHGDIMAERDIGWIQIFVENGQEAFDHSIMAFEIAEDHRVLLPMIVNLDGFILSHVVEAHELLDQETVDRFLPPLVPYHRLDPAKPVIMGSRGEVAEPAVDELQALGEPVGLVKMRLWRPFPFEELRKAVAGADLVLVCDRALSLGGGANPGLAEGRSALYPLAVRPQVLGYTVGLGGRDVQPADFIKPLRHGQAEAQQGPSQEFFMYG